MNTEHGSEIEDKKAADSSVISVAWNGTRKEKPAKQDEKMIYAVSDVPPFYMCPVYGLQQALMCVLGSMSVPFIISNAICAHELPEVRAQLMSITFFMCGVATLLQTTLGVRLPIIQGGSYAFLPPIVVMMQLDKWRCPAPKEASACDEEPWLARTREIQGNLMLASLTQVFLGCSGLLGVLLRFVGPMTVGPTLALIGLGFYSTAVNDFAEKQWGIAAFTAFMLLVFSIWLHGCMLPIPSCCRHGGRQASRLPVFTLLSVLLAVGLGWLLCFALTAADVLPANSTKPAYYARTDINLHVVETSPWFALPYPFQFGLPTVSLAGFVTLVVPTFSSIVESVGDYYACARVSGTHAPPPHAVSRGIAIEGFSSVLSGMMGSGHGTTSYSGNIAAIGITRVASRRVFQTAGLILVLMGVVTKFGAMVTLLPAPVMGGLNAVLLSTLVGVAVCTLSNADLTSHRNVTVTGMALLLGLSVPQWVNAFPGRIDTGSADLDHVLNVLLGTPLFVGGFVGFILDNALPGTLEERGLLRWQETTAASGKETNRTNPSKPETGVSEDIYDLPYVTKILKRFWFSKYVPIFPTFNGCCSAAHQRDKAKGGHSRGTSGYENEGFPGDTTSF